MINEINEFLKINQIKMKLKAEMEKITGNDWLQLKCEKQKNIPLFL